MHRSREEALRGEGKRTGDHLPLFHIHVTPGRAKKLLLLRVTKSPVPPSGPRLSLLGSVRSDAPLGYSAPARRSS